jgi:phosphatidylglycerophosphate synthase
MNSGQDVREADTAIGQNGSAPRDHRSQSLRDLYRLARARSSGGYLFTTYVSDRLGSWFAAVAIRFHIHPTVVTLTDLGLAIVASTFVITQAPHLQSGWVPGLAALLLWQLAYILDCADGQVARVTGKTSSFGARVDVLVDFLVYAIVFSALVTVLTQRVELPVALVVLGAIVWPVGLLTFILAGRDGNEGHSFSPRGGVFGVIKLIGDNGFVLLVMGLWLFVHPQSIVIPVAAICAVNACFLVASIAREAYLSVRIGSGVGRRAEEVGKS